MKKLITFLHNTFSKTHRSDSDPVQAFFAEGNTEAKKLVYEKTLRAAEVDQKKVIAEYYKKSEHLQQA